MDTHTSPGLDPTAVRARDARTEAQEIVGYGFTARVLEPSPPAVDDEWFADDPVDVDPVDVDPASGSHVVAPITGATLTWDDWLHDHPQQSDWAGARWLGAHRRLPAPPPGLAQTRNALHRLTVYVVAPARRRANGKIGLRFTYAGFGTPFFAGNEQVRVAGTSVVRQRGNSAVAEPITSIARAAALVLDGRPDIAWAAPFDVPDAGDVDEQLPVEADAAAFLADWYGFAFSVLEEVRHDGETPDPSRVQLWPEHFDAAFDCLPDDRRPRATLGASPGDGQTPEPYLYVTHGRGDALPRDATWNATTFPGAILPMRELVGAADQRGAALAFHPVRRDALGGGA